MIFLIIILGAILRLYGIMWDKGFHLHPDERMLIMVAERIHFFNRLNPDFFNYGSLPIYVLRGITQLLDSIFKLNYGTYDGMLVVGRMLSVMFDIGTLYVVFKTAQLLFSKNQKIAYFSAFCYAIAFFPIQNSHFFVVDVFLNLFITLLVYNLLLYLQRPTLNRVVVIGVIFAACLATKVTPIIFLPILLIIIVIKNIKQLITFTFSFFIFNFLFMPYAFINHQRFISDVLAQVRMNSDPYIFPYTLQYVTTLPYLYYLKNIFLWGLGPFISILSVVGMIKICLDLVGHLTYVNKSKIKMEKSKLQIKMQKLVLFIIHNQFLMVWLLIYLFYFLIIGRSAVKFMRYMLSLYPVFAILAGVGLYQILKSVLKNRCRNKFGMTVFVVFISCCLLWSFMFINIYSRPHTRIAATEWIEKNIPAGSTLAVEHWDDRIPIYEGENYKYEEMTIYELPDNEIKWNGLYEKLEKTDYIILASNRLYTPLPRLADCKKYRSCYPKTSEYYQKLFSGSLSASNGTFKQIAEFSSPPSLHVLGLTIYVDDQSADESFTVYDHPKILIFKKISK